VNTSSEGQARRAIRHAVNSEDQSMRVNWDDLLLAYEFVSSIGPVEHHAWLCRSSGTTYWDFGEGGRLDEPSDDLDEPSEDEEGAGGAASDDPNRLPADIDDEEKYLPIPNKRDLDLGTPLVLPSHASSCPGITMMSGASSASGGLLQIQGLAGPTERGQSAARLREQSH
jgi:hypothetical protein